MTFLRAKKRKKICLFFWKKNVKKIKKQMRKILDISSFTVFIFLKNMLKKCKEKEVIF